MPAEPTDPIATVRARAERLWQALDEDFGLIGERLGRFGGGSQSTQGGH